MTDKDWDSTAVDTDDLAKRMLTALDESGVAAELIDTDEEVVDIRLDPTAWSTGPYGDCEHLDLAWRGGRGQWTLVGHWGRDSTSTDDQDGSDAESVSAVANIAGQIAEMVGMATHDEVPADAVRQPVGAAPTPVRGADPIGPQTGSDGECGPLGRLAHDIYENNVKHGFWDAERNFGEILALIHSEVSEALEEYRDGHAVGERYYRADGKPEGVPSELADVVIRVLDVCAGFGIDIDDVIAEKMRFNAGRPYRHGKAF